MFGERRGEHLDAPAPPCTAQADVLEQVVEAAVLVDERVEPVVGLPGEPQLREQATFLLLGVVVQEERELVDRGQDRGVVAALRRLPRPVAEVEDPLVLGRQLLDGWLRRQPQ